MINIIHPKSKAQYQRYMLRQQLLLAKGFSAGVRGVFNAIYAREAEMVKHGQRVVFLDPGHRVALVKLFRSHYKHIGTIMSEQVFAVVRGQELRSTEPPELKSMGDEFWAAFGTYSDLNTARKVTQVLNTTKKLLAKIIADGMQAGKSPADIAKEIVATGLGFNKKRAARIARTETHSISNFATHEAVKSTRLRMEKEWVAFIDDRTRPEKGANPKWDHRKANGQRVGMDDPFDVSGEKLMYPGDPSGSPGNIIHCRCVVMYHTVRLKR